jgi:hypothetical protein
MLAGNIKKGMRGKRSGLVRVKNELENASSTFVRMSAQWVIQLDIQRHGAVAADKGLSRLAGGQKSREETHRLAIPH